MKRSTLVCSAIFVATLATICLAESPQAVTSLEKALEQAHKQGKLLFVQEGRPSCGNCQALRGYIAAGKVDLPTNLFVYADVNCDDPKTAQAFSKHFKVEGNMLPFVAIADSDGKQLAARAGFGKPDDFQELIKNAEKKATKSTAIKKANAADKPAGAPAEANAAPAAHP
jgi:type IV secretory pathway protease TraF